MSVVGVALAAGSLRWSAEPHYDAWAWLSWGRQIVHAPWSLSTANGPSWKPLTALLAGGVSLAGAAAPALWLVLVRAAGIASLVLVGRLAAASAGLTGAVVAAGALAVSQGWWLGLSWGASEPVLLALLAWAAVEQHRGRERRAHLLLAGAALCRIEVVPFLVLHGWRVARRYPHGLLLASLSLAVVLALWFGPDWYSTGDPFNQSREALHSQEALSTAHDALGATATVARRAWDVLPTPVWVLAAMGLGWAAHSGERWILRLAALALAWDAVVLALTMRGYAGLGRFTLPAAAAVCVFAGLGARSFAAAVPQPRLAAALSVGLLGLALPPWLGVVATGSDQAGDAAGGPAVAALDRGIAGIGGPQTLGRHTGLRVNGPLGTALAWELREPIGVVNVADGRARRWAIFTVARGAFSGQGPRVPHGAVCRALHWANVRVMLVAR
ncbi:MAG: hypothetical protein ACXVII_36775, partial [Solirubrobacteraceae bacterium]